MFTGLSAFPLTPLHNEQLDEKSYVKLLTRLAQAKVDSITTLGSTGSYMYLDRDERKKTVELAVAHAENTPVIAGIGALRTKDVKRAAEDAQNAGASGVLLAPVSYQYLTEEDVFGLFEEVTAELSVPLAVYDNPGTTHFDFTDELYVRISELPHVASIKIPGVPSDQALATERVSRLKSVLPEGITLGISTDPVAATGLIAGCEAWYSVIAGTLPLTAQEITQALKNGGARAAIEASARLNPLWDLFNQFGSYRVIAVIAHHLGLVEADTLPKPLRGLDASERDRVVQVISQLEVRG